MAKLKDRDKDLMDEADAQSEGYTSEQARKYAKAYREEQKKDPEGKGLFTGNKADRAGKKAAEGESYEDDFEVEAEILELKKEKEELLKGISGKSGPERKEIEKKLRELNDKIMDLENK